MTNPPADSILTQIMREAAEYTRSGRKFLTVFDLDSTLFDLTTRVSKIVDQFAQDPENQKKFPIECKALETVQIAREDWGMGESLGRAGIQEANSPEFWKALHDFWAICFFSDNFLHHDEPLPGAVEYVLALRAIGADVMYLTGRDVPRMKKGTEESLRACGFPLGEENAKLILKPSSGLDDAAFKVMVLKESERQYERIWLFENEPVNLNLVAKHCPAIGLVFIESTHSGREQIADTLDRIVHFEVDLAEFRGKWKPSVGKA